jgi:type II secretory pathway component HofQ
MYVTASDYQSLKLKIKELEEIVAELKSDNGEKAKLIEELKAKLAKYENPHTPSSAQDIRRNQNPKTHQRSVVLQMGIEVQPEQRLNPTGWWKSQLSIVSIVAVPI